MIPAILFASISKARAKQQGAHEVQSFNEAKAVMPLHKREMGSSRFDAQRLLRHVITNAAGLARPPGPLMVASVQRYRASARDGRHHSRMSSSAEAFTVSRTLLWIRAGVA